ncbi:MAG: hypothetical protein QJR03_03195, partial [Sphaerobacter sp.]|nr:hypothetical protein [Sphaerobacter sp.]
MSAPPAGPVAPGGISSAHAPDLNLPARFMALGMFGFLGVAALAPFAVPLFAGGFSDSRVLVFVHLNTLGVVAAMILGASYQLVPVVLQTPLASARAVRWSFWAFVGGLVFMLPGLLTLRHWALGTGATLLVVAFALYIGVVGSTLRRAGRWDVVSMHLAAALLSLAGGVVVGLLLAGNKGHGFLGGMTYPLLAAHVTLLLAGWVAVLLAGVAYRLVGMFTLSEDALWRPAAWAELALTAGGAWVLAASFVLRAGRTAGPAGALAIVAGQALFLAQLLHLYRVRRRRGFDVHIPFALTAAAGGVGAAALLTGGLALGVGVSSPLWVVVVWLGLGGLAETAIQGFSYKITTFLVWLHRYAPVAGRQRVPRLEDLYRRRLAVAGWMLWTAGMALSLMVAPLGCAPLGRIAGAALAAGLGCFLINL